MLERTHQETFQNFRFSNFGKAVFPCLEIEIFRSMMRSLSFTAGDLADFFAKVFALRNKKVTVLWPAPPALPGPTLLRKSKPSYIKSRGNHLA